MSDLEYLDYRVILEWFEAYEKEKTLSKYDLDTVEKVRSLCKKSFDEISDSTK